eukprot:m.431580 g.431580  ORF g.431580 m.431580 type:complete len:132 (+) comp21405_c0_seq4:1648-2043(+)
MRCSSAQIDPGTENNVPTGTMCSVTVLCWDRKHASSTSFFRVLSNLSFQAKRALCFMLGLYEENDPATGKKHSTSKTGVKDNRSEVVKAPRSASVEVPINLAALAKGPPAPNKSSRLAAHVETAVDINDIS